MLPANSPRLQSPSLLVFFTPDGIGKFPGHPLDILLPPRSLKIVDVGSGQVLADMPMGTMAQLKEGIRAVIATASRYQIVYTVHANSLLGRLCKWRASAENLTLPLSLTTLRDLVEIVNAPAVLSMAERYGFSLAQTLPFLDLPTPEDTVDPTVHYFIEIIQRYV